MLDELRVAGIYYLCVISAAIAANVDVFCACQRLVLQHGFLTFLRSAQGASQGLYNLFLSYSQAFKVILERYPPDQWYVTSFWIISVWIPILLTHTKCPGRRPGRLDLQVLPLSLNVTSMRSFTTLRLS